MRITIIMASPHNPTGKVFNIQDLSHIATLCHKYNLLAITDEVKTQVWTHRCRYFLYQSTWFYTYNIDRASMCGKYKYQCSVRLIGFHGSGNVKKLCSRILVIWFLNLSSTKVWSHAGGWISYYMVFTSDWTLIPLGHNHSVPRIYSVTILHLSTYLSTCISYKMFHNFCLVSGLWTHYLWIHKAYQSCISPRNVGTHNNNFLIIKDLQRNRSVPS